MLVLELGRALDLEEVPCVAGGRRQDVGDRVGLAGDESGLEERLVILQGFDGLVAMPLR